MKDLLKLYENNCGNVSLKRFMKFSEMHFSKVNNKKFIKLYEKFIKFCENNNYVIKNYYNFRSFVFENL